MSYDHEQPGDELHQFNGQSLSSAEVYGLLDAYLTDELESQDSSMVQRHLAQCQKCQETLLEIQQYRRLLYNVLPDEALAAQVSPAGRTPEQASQVPPEARDRESQSGQLSTLPARGHKQAGRLQRVGARLLIAAVVALLIASSVLLFGVFGPRFNTGTGRAGVTPGLSPSHTVAATSTPDKDGWRQLWALPTLPPPPSSAYGAEPPYMPQIAWSPANPQRLYLCRASPDYSGMPAVLRDLYRSDDQGAHWTALPLPEAAANCRLTVDPTNANLLVLQDDKNNSYVSSDGGQHWRVIPDPPAWNAGLSVPNIQVVAGRVYAEGYWTTDEQTWTRWYPVPDEKSHVYVQVNPQNPDILYTVILAKVGGVDFQCQGMSSQDVSKLGQNSAFLSALCRSSDGGLTWQFVAILYNSQVNNFLPSFCMVLDRPDTLYAWGYTHQQDATAAPGGTLRSTDGGATWSRLPAYFDGPEVVNLPCSLGQYGGSQDIPVDAAMQGGIAQDQWYDFDLTADGNVYHISDTSSTRQGLTIPAGVSLLTASGWKQIAPYPSDLTTSTTTNLLRMLLITPAAGPPLLLAYTQQNMYAYTGSLALS